VRNISSTDLLLLMMVPGKMVLGLFMAWQVKRCRSEAVLVVE
jgi:hypothetical protein